MIIDIPTVEGGEFIDGGPNTLGTIVTAAFLNSLMKSSTATTKEIQTILTNAGIAPDSRVHDQLFKAISKMITDNKVALTDVLGTSKEIAASQFLVNTVNNKIPALTSTLSDSTTLAATPLMVNNVNRTAKNAETIGINADAKAVGAQTTANQAKAAAANAQISADEAFKDRGALGTIDLDTLGSQQHCGVYHQIGNANATAARHYPEQMAGSLLVMMAAGVTQIYIRYNSSNVWIRNNYQNKWSDWDRLAKSSEIIQLLQATGSSTTAAMSQDAATRLFALKSAANTASANKQWWKCGATGLIEQQFETTTLAGDIVFPIPFPTRVNSIVVSADGNSVTPNNFLIYVNPIDRTKFNLRVANFGATKAFIKATGY